jgi:hypothetical protein
LLRTLAWLVALGAGAACAALAGYDLTHPDQEASELMASFGIGAFLLLIALGCAGLLRSGFRLGDDYIEVVRPFGTTRLAVGDLAGFGTLILSVNHVPTLYMRLYRAGPAEIAKLPVAVRDRAEVEAWFAARLPLVVDEGSLLQPRPRYCDRKLAGMMITIG